MNDNFGMDYIFENSYTLNNSEHMFKLVVILILNECVRPTSDRGAKLEPYVIVLQSFIHPFHLYQGLCFVYVEKINVLNLKKKSIVVSN